RARSVRRSTKERPVTVPRPEARRQSGALFGLVVGMFIAALLGDLVFPRHQPVVSTQGSRVAEQSGTGAVAGGGAGEATSVAGATPEGTGAPAAAAGAPGGPATAGGAASSAAAVGGGAP